MANNHARLKKWLHKDLRRHRVPHQYQTSRLIRVSDTFKEYVHFGSNDYLGLLHHPLITDAIPSMMRQFGIGSGGSAMVSGYTAAHQACEAQFADWLGVDKTIVFPTGYMANMGTITALCDRNTQVYSDKLCHASILDGIRLSRAKHYRYKHCDSEHLESLLSASGHQCIVTESVFSQTGAIAPVAQLVKQAKFGKDDLIIDDAHGMGVLGHSGKGVCQEFQLNQDQFSCLVIPLGKAFNSQGAIVAGRKDVIETLLQFANTYRYSTAIPAILCASHLAALNVINNESWRHDKLIENIDFFIQQATRSGLPLSSTALTPIKSMVVGSNKASVQLHHSLLKQGFYVPAMRPPTVPNHAACLRICVNCLHTKEDMSCLIKSIGRHIHHD